MHRTRSSRLTVGIAATLALAMAMRTCTARLLVEPGKKLHLRDVDPRSTKGFDGEKDEGRARVRELNEKLGDLQEALYAEGKRSLLVVLQAMDAGGKDGTIRSVFEGV